MGKLTMTNKNKQHLKRGYELLGVFDGRVNSAVIVNLVSFENAKKLAYGALIIFSSGFFYVNAKQSEIIFSESRVVPFSFQTLGHVFIEQKEERISNSIEFLTSVSMHRAPVAVPSTETKRNDSPQKNDEGRVGVEKQSELTPEGIHKFWQLLLSMIATSLFLFPLGAYFSMRGTLRCDWAKHKSKSRVPKALPLAMIFILSVPRSVKSHRWQIWEQRHWFRDMKECHGLDRAYQDTQFWKWSINKTDYQ